MPFQGVEETDHHEIQVWRMGKDCLRKDCIRHGEEVVIRFKCHRANTREQGIALLEYEADLGESFERVSMLQNLVGVTDHDHGVRDFPQDAYRSMQQ